MPSSLPSLTTLNIHCTLAPGELSQLPRALAHGASPLLVHLTFPCGGAVESDLDSIADMLEKRVNIPSCKRLECFDGGDTAWFAQASLETQTRSLCVLLPSVTKLPQLSWRHAFGPCICETGAPYLTALEIGFTDYFAGNVFPWDVFEAAPALEKIAFERRGESMFDSTVLQAVNEALRRGALQNLVEIELEDCDLEDNETFRTSWPLWRIRAARSG